MLFDADQLLAPLVLELARANNEPRDAAAFALAYRLAAAVDQAHSMRDLAELSSKLMTILDAIFATPKSRAASAKAPATEVKTSEPISELAKLRAIHARRTRGAASVDSAAAPADA